jgi:hypothetical protein
MNNMFVYTCYGEGYEEGSYCIEIINQFDDVKLSNYFDVRKEDLPQLQRLLNDLKNNNVPHHSAGFTVEYGFVSYGHETGLVIINESINYGRGFDTFIVIKNKEHILGLINFIIGLFEEDK